MRSAEFYRSFRKALICASIVAVAPCAAGAQTAGITVYEGALLIDGRGGAPIENATVVVDGAKIVAVGKSGEVQLPAGANRLSLAGKIIMPMMIDAHVHLSQSREGIVRDLKRRAWFGVSTVFSAGTDKYENLDLRTKIEPGSATFQSAGRGITMPEPGRINVPHWINDEAEGRKVVQELASQKVDMVKVWVDSRDGKFKKVSPEIYAAIIDEAHKRNLRVMAHIFEMEDAKGLIKAGVDVFAHGIRDREIDDEMVALFKSKPGIVLTPNLPDRGVKVDISWKKGGVPADEFAKLDAQNVDSPKLQAFHAIQARNLAKLNDAGVKIALATDGNRPWGPHDEMEDMVLAGLTPMQALLAATRNSAEVLRLADRGTIEAGKSADLLVLDANPLDDIKNTRRISQVVLRGEAVDRSKTP